jgi:hypothetical protein
MNLRREMLASILLCQLSREFQNTVPHGNATEPP